MIPSPSCSIDHPSLNDLDPGEAGTSHSKQVGHVVVIVGQMGKLVQQLLQSWPVGQLLQLRLVGQLLQLRLVGQLLQLWLVRQLLQLWLVRQHIA